MTELAPKSSRLLVVDDGADYVTALREVLAATGYTAVRTLTDPLRVREVYEEWRPDLVILDLWMPELDGFGVMEQLRSLVPEDSPLPVLVMTADRTSSALERALALGARDFVTKPFDGVEIALRVANVLETMRLQKRLDEEAKEALSAERRLLRAVLDSVEAGIVTCDAAGSLTLFNRAARQWHDAEAEAIPAERWAERYDLFHADGKTPLVMEEVPLYRASRGLEVQQVELVIAPRNGPARRVMCTGRPLLADDGRNLGAVVAMTDVTELRKAEEELRRQREARHHSEKLAALGTLLAGVAHELNNPLAVVQGQARLLNEAAGGTPFATRAAKIAASAERCTRIVRNFLALARDHPQERASVSVNKVVEEAVELVAYPLRVESIGVEVQLDLALPRLWADQHQLHQVLVNLITNAHHALRDSPPPRLLRITSRFETDRSRGVLEISDTGPGIPPDIQARVFEPFFTTKPAGVGTGLGLALCRGIVEAHGGTISVDSAPGRGTTFRVELPVIGEPAGRPGTPPARVAEPRRARAGRILVVDDEPEVAEVLVDLLCDHVVDVAANGIEALARLAASSYDVLLSDVRMPEMDGPALYRELQRTHPDLVGRMAFVTGDSISADVQAFLAETRVATLSKPFDFEAVLLLVDRLMEGAPR